MTNIASEIPARPARRTRTPQVPTLDQMARSVHSDQEEVLRSIMALAGIARFDADLTYGNGNFYRNLPKPVHRFDLDDGLIGRDGVMHATSEDVPLDDSSIGSAVFDPPFLTYVDNGRKGPGKTNNGSKGRMLMAKQFSGYWTYGELADHYRKTIVECFRLLRYKGLLVFKCQDIIHNHRMHCTHANVLDWSREYFSLKDLYILTADRRLPAGNPFGGTQKHARIFHSYFLVLQRRKHREMINSEYY